MGSKRAPLFLLLSITLALFNAGVNAQPHTPDFKVIAFYTAKNDQAHISYVNEANRWFPEMGKKYNFSYDATSDWKNMNAAFLASYQVILFLDTRPEESSQRAAFRQYMEKGGGWIGFHFAAFALTPSDFPQNWDWYHHQFLGSGSYSSNTWKPTSAILRVENRKHPINSKLPETFNSAANEWYRWSEDLRTNPDIQILLSIDTSSFPLGTGPKLSEIWHSGYYPVAWTNIKYRMIYINMGHNDMDYENHSVRDLSSSFSSKTQNEFLLRSLFFAAGKTLR